MKSDAMFRLNIGLFCLLLLPTAAVAAEQRPDDYPPAPDFSLPSGNGLITLQDYRGKVVYLDFWASWCGPCRATFPWLNELQQRYSTEGKPRDLVVIGINLDSEAHLARQFLSRYPASFTIAYDPLGEVAERYQLQGMPSAYLIDRDGRLHSRHVGFREGDKQALESAIQQLIGHKLAWSSTTP